MGWGGVGWGATVDSKLQMCTATPACCTNCKFINEFRCFQILMPSASLAE